MKREDCYMSFSEALDMYMRASKEMEHFGVGGGNWRFAKDQMDTAKAHMDALTDSTHIGA